MGVAPRACNRGRAHAHASHGPSAHRLLTLNLRMHGHTLARTHTPTHAHSHAYQPSWHTLTAGCMRILTVGTHVSIAPLYLRIRATQCLCTRACPPRHLICLRALGPPTCAKLGPTRLATTVLASRVVEASLESREVPRGPVRAFAFQELLKVRSSKVWPRFSR